MTLKPPGEPNTPRTRTDVINVQDYGAVGDGTTNDLSAVAQAIGSAPPGTSVYFPGGRTYLLKGAITPAHALDFVGDGSGTVLRLGNLTASAIGNLFDLTDAPGIFSFRDLTLQAPASQGAGAESRGVTAFSQVQTLRFERVRFDGFNYGVKVDGDPGGDVRLELTDCEVEGNASDSFGVGMFAPVGSLRARDCLVHRVGKLDSALRHGFYVHDHIDADIAGCSFHSGYGSGYAIHFFGGSSSARTHRVQNCSFYYTADVSGDSMQAVLVSRYTPLQMSDCTADCYGKALTLAGIAYVSNCRFTGTGGNDYRVYTGATAITPGGLIEGCVFEGDQFVGLNLDTGSLYLTLRGNKFLGSAGSAQIDVSTTGSLRVTGNEFGGEGRCVDLSVPMAALIVGNEFSNTGASIRASDDMTRLVIRDNDLSNDGTGVQITAAQSNQDAADNYGSNAVIP